jgi:hypothetical protein
MRKRSGDAMEEMEFGGVQSFFLSLGNGKHNI